MTTSRRSGLTLVELLVLVAIIGILLSIVVPGLLRSKTGNLEEAAIRRMRVISLAQGQYQTQYGAYAATLGTLGPPLEGSPDREAAAFIPLELAKGEVAGYRYKVASVDDGFAATGMPVEFGTTGRRTFFVDETGVVRQNTGPDAATAESDPVR
jgi:type II secretory pathway pseudopilin PulG